MGNLSESLRAKAAHDNEVLRAFERPVFAAVFDDAVGQAGADAGQCFKLSDVGSIEIDQ